MGLEEGITSEAAKVRLVRCPKCENLLPELPDIPLYQCGGCGAVLKAKKKSFLEDGMPAITDSIKGTRISDEGSAVGYSKVGVESKDGTEVSKVERIHYDKVAADGTFNSKVEDREVLSDSGLTRRGKERIRRIECEDDDYMPYAPSLVGNANRGRNCDLDFNGSEYTRLNGEHASLEMRTPVELLRPRPIMDQSDVVASIGPEKDVAAQLRSHNFLYHSEGPSNHDLGSSYEYDGRTRYQDHDFDGLSRVKNLENDRAKLLKKLDELKDQISRSCDVGDKQKERINNDRRMEIPAASDPYGRNHATYVQEGLTSSHGVNKQPLSTYDMETPYVNHMRGFIPYTDMIGSSSLSLYPPCSSSLSLYPPRGFTRLGNGDIYRPEILRRPPMQTQSQYMHHPYHDQFPAYCGDINHDHFMVRRHENLFHQPACSCVHCCNKNWHIPPGADHSGFHNQRFRSEASNQNFQHRMNNPHGPQSYGLGGSGLYNMPSRQPITEKAGDHNRPRKVLVAHRSGLVCHPVAGGAPFITCCNCFELLKLPRKCISSAKLQHKMKCGACSSIMSFEVGTNGFIGSVSVHVDQVPTEIDNGSSGTMDEHVIYWPGDSNSVDMNGCSNDCNELQARFPPTDKKSNSGESDKPPDPLSLNLSLLENGCSPENLTLRKQYSPSAEGSLDEMKSYTHCSNINLISQLDKGNKSKRTEKERVVLDRTASRQNSVTEAAMATEMDMPLHEFPNSCVSQDPVEISNEDHQKAQKGGDSFFAGFIKKSFRDFTKFSQSVEVSGSQVFVNGHMIADRAVKKAEKLAGPIQPGEYWYDIHAGFWGVLGHPCLGIIMPCIEEFNFPMPENCAAGNTSVFVNGRELHQKDLDLLTGRGLPISRNRSYIIDMSGKVVDENTGEELDCLGKLAPTVERAKRGFGMKAPRCLPA